jgi:hypothetical protein
VAAFSQMPRGSVKLQIWSAAAERSGDTALDWSASVLACIFQGGNRDGCAPVNTNFKLGRYRALHVLDSFDPRGV